jgi:hypothetical protein
MALTDALIGAEQFATTGADTVSIGLDDPVAGVAIELQESALMNGRTNFAIHGREPQRAMGFTISELEWSSAVAP